MHLRNTTGLRPAGAVLTFVLAYLIIVITPKWSDEMKKSLILVVLTSTAQAALAQQRTDAGQQIQQIPQAPEWQRPAPAVRVDKRTATAPSGEGGVRVQVDALKVSGETLFSEQALIAATNFKPGSAVNLPELRGLAARITRFYNDRGYFLAQAYLPAQDITGRSVTIKVVEGRYGGVAVHNSAGLSGGLAAAPWPDFTAVR
jgi:hemolysin activation/secretion protein